MRYRFFTTEHSYTDKDGKLVETYKKWSFLSEKQIESIIDCYEDKNCFYSIQTYDKDGNNKECPIYFDLDGPSARDDAMDLAHKIKDKLGVYPEIWDSGSKGYHVIVPKSIIDPKCEKIASYIALSFNPGPSFDPVVYKSRNMWRIPGTVNQKSGRRKMKVNMKYKCDMSTFNLGRMIHLVEEAKIKIKEDEAIEVERKESEVTGDFQLEMTPCIENLIKNGTVDGKWNPSLVLIARFFRACGTPREDAINYLFQYPHLYYRRTAIRNAFKSIYGSTNKATFGCRNEDLLKEKCNKFLCVYYKGD